MGKPQATILTVLVILALGGVAQWTVEYFGVTPPTVSTILLPTPPVATTQPVTTQPAPPPEVTLADVLKSSVLVHGNGSGSGLVIRCDSAGAFVLTAGHVAEGLAEVTVKQKDQEWIGKVVVCWPGGEKDLALIRVLGCQLPPVTVASTPAELGEQVWLLGYPLGDGPFVTSGFVSRLDGYMYCSPDAEPGNSGSPMLVQRDGGLAVAGVFVQGFSAHWGPIPFMGRAVPLPAILELLEFVGWQ